MPIVVNLDIMMARRKITLHHSRQPFHPEDRQGKSHPLLHPRSHLQGARLPAGGFVGVQGGGIDDKNAVLK